MKISRVKKERILIEYQKHLGSSGVGYICPFLKNISKYSLLDHFEHYMNLQGMRNTYDRGINEYLGLDITDLHCDNFEVYQSIRYMVLEHFLDSLMD